MTKCIVAILIVLGIAGCGGSFPPNLPACVESATCVPEASTRPDTLTVAGLRDNLLDLDGRQVTVRGTFSNCRGNSCSICQTENKKGPCVSMGSNEQFDRQISQYLGREVLVEGTVSAACHRADIICLDRLETLKKPVFLWVLN